MKKSNNKLLNIIVISLAAVFAATASAVTIYAVNNNTSAVEEISETEPVTEDTPDAETYESGNEGIEYEDIDLEEKTRELDMLYDKYDKNDMEALKIFRGYGITGATEIIQDKEEDMKLMFKVCDMLRKNEFTTEEKPVAELYLERRYFLVDDYNDETTDDNKLLKEILELLGYDRLAEVMYQSVFT